MPPFAWRWCRHDGTADATYIVAAHKVLGKNPVIATATGYTADGVTNWTPAACCPVPLAQADISAAYDQPAIDKALGFKSWAITTMVQEWLANPAANFGLLLNSDASKAATAIDTSPAWSTPTRACVPT